MAAAPPPRSREEAWQSPQNMAAAPPPRSREEAWNSSPRNSSPRAAEAAPRASRAWSEDVAADAAAADGEDPRRRAPSRAWSEDLASSDDERRRPPPPPRVRHLESLVAWCAGRVDASERASAWGQPRRGDAELVAARRRTLVEARARLAATRSKAAAPARAATSDRVFRVAMRDGVELNARVTAPAAPGLSAPVAALCVPSLGGTSELPELGRVAARLAAEGHVCVRFDLRGTGLSRGAASLGEPGAELADVGELAAWARRRFGASRVVAVGVSFGALLALAAAARFAAVDGAAAVSYPTDYVWYLATPLAAGAWRKRAAGCAKPRLFVWGARDVYAALPASLAWYRTLPQPKDLVLFKGLDPRRGHMFHTADLLDALADHVAVWLARHFAPGAETPRAARAGYAAEPHEPPATPHEPPATPISDAALAFL